MKRILPFLTVLTAMLLLAGCGNNSNQISPAPQSSDKAVSPPAPGNSTPAGVNTNTATTRTNAMGNGASANSGP